MNITLNSESYFETIENDFNNKLDELKKSILLSDDQIYSKIEQVRNEIDLRVESLKQDIDQLNEKFQKELDVLRDNWFKESRIYYEQKLDKFRSHFENIKTQDSLETKFEQESYVDVVENIDKLRTSVKKFKYDIKFQTSTQLKIEDLFGNLQFNKNIKQCLVTKDIDVKSFLTKLSSEKPYKLHVLEAKPDYLCVLPNGHLLTSNTYERNLKLYNSTFHLEKTIHHFDNQSIYPTSIATNDYSEVYILDNYLRQLIITDLDLNKLKAINLNQKNGIKATEICYQNSSLYASDSLNKKILAFDSNFVVIKALKLDFEPINFKIANDVVCVNGVKTTYFYNFDSSNLLAEYDNIYGRVNEINSNFYVYSPYYETIYCFNNFGGLTLENKTKLFKHSLNLNIIAFHDYIVSSTDSKKIYVFHENSDYQK